MRALLKSVWLFVFGIVSRFYYWAFALLLDPFDIYGRFKPAAWPELNVPTSLGWFILFALFFWCAMLTFHETRMAGEGRSGERDKDAAARDSLRRLVKRRKTFTAGELACLLAGTEFTRGDITGPAAAYLHDIIRAVRAKRLKPVTLPFDLRMVMATDLVHGRPEKETDIQNRIEISRDDAAAMAHSYGISIPGLTKSDLSRSNRRHYLQQKHSRKAALACTRFG